MSIHVFSGGQGRKAYTLAAGLRWTVLDSAGEGKRARSGGSSAIRKKLKDVDATRYVITKLRGVRYLGMYADPVTLKDVGKRYSLAMLLLNGLVQSSDDKDQLPSAIFMLVPPAMPTKRVLIVIEDGVVSLDVVWDATKALEEVNSRKRSLPRVSVFSDSADVAGAFPATWDDIVEGLDAGRRAALLQNIPVSPYTVLAAFAVVGIGALAFSYHKLVVVPEQKRLAAIKAQEADRTPDYLVAVDGMLSSSGWDRAGVKALIQKVRGTDPFVAGWRILSIDCAKQQCATTWERRGGTVAALQAALVDQKVMAADSALDRTVSVGKIEVPAQQWGREKLAGQDESLLDVRNALQTFGNAGISSSVGRFEKFNIPDMAGVSPDSMVYGASTEVSVPLFLADQAVEMLPQRVLINGFFLNLGDDAISVNVKGRIYARQ